MPDLQQPAKSSTALLVVSWLVVILPTAWGLQHTIQSALKLFASPAPAASAPQTGAPAKSNP